MSGQVTILQLPTASALTGTEAVPVVQNGVTVQTTTSAVAGAGALNYPFITIGSTSGLTTARQLLATTGLSLTDSGAGGSVTINMTGTALSLNAASTGIIVKDSASTVTSRTLAVGSGMTLSNADGISGNPTFGLSTILQNLASATSSGMLSLNGTTISTLTIQGTSGQVSVANGNGVGGAPTIGLATTAVTAGSYTLSSVTFDAYGRATAASSASTTGSGNVVLATSPTLTGIPLAPTAAFNTNTTQLATTAFVIQQVSASGGGTVTSLSVNSANGFAGTVTNPTSTPAITLSTTITGLLKGNGTAISAATSGTDYAPATSGSSILYGNNSGGFSNVSIGNGLTFSAGTLSVNSGYVTSISFGSTGLTPSTATSGAVSVGGTLAVGSGGTGLATLATGRIPYGNGTGALSSNSGFYYDATNSTLVVPVVAANQYTSITPVLSFNASNSIIQLGATVSGSYMQGLMQNLSAMAGASTNWIISNNLGTDSSYYGEFGMNSSVYTASGTFADFYSINNGIYFSGHDGDISIGSGNGLKTYLTWGTAGQSAHVINATGAIGLSTNLGTTAATTGTSGFGTAGYLMQTNGSAAAPTWVAQSTLSVGTATNATNVALTAGTGATNYIHFSASATGNQPTTTNTLLTYNYTNNTITAGISGGTF